jgi:SH3 domain-containing protein
MKKHLFYRLSLIIVTLIFILTAAGCAGNVPATITEPASSPAPVASAAPSLVSTDTTPVETTPTAVPVSDSNILYQDDFTNPATGWSEDKFDNYFVGYHEPEYYHIEITSPNSKTTVFEPQKKSFDDVTIELDVLTVSAKTAAEGDFRYGLAFRRAGDQYYAFTISPRTKKWFVLKNSPSALTVLAEGIDNNIHEVDKDDTLRVDAQGSNFTFHINDEIVGQATDSDYASGEVGFYVETFDATNAHIHFDKLTIRKLEMPAPQDAGSAVLYQDDFTNPSTNWPDRKFDNYFIGYHEPEYYHVEVTSPNYKTTVFEPQKKSFNDFTVELQVLTVSAKTAAEGDFRYGLAFRRSGDQYYAFTISPRTKKWFVLKNSPSVLTVLAEGTDESIHDLDNDDTLRVDAQGPNFLFHINDQLVGQATDSDYAGGEVGFYVESFDVPNVHIHFDKLTIRDLILDLMCNINGGTVYVRSGPGKTYSQIAVLSDGDTVQALGISPNQWIKIKVKGSNDPGWVSYSEGYMSCTPTVDLFPLISP